MFYLKKLRFVLLLSCLSLVMLAGVRGLSAETFLPEDRDSWTETKEGWSMHCHDAGCHPNYYLQLDRANKKEGASSLKVTYRFPENDGSNIRLNYGFPEPLDISSYKYLKFWVYNSTETKQIGLPLYLYTVDKEGKAADYRCYYTYLTSKGWKLCTFDLDKYNWDSKGKKPFNKKSLSRLLFTISNEKRGKSEEERYILIDNLHFSTVKETKDEVIAKEKEREKTEEAIGMGKIFWLNRPLLFPQDSVQYLNLPMSGLKDIDKIKDFRYVFTLPKEFKILPLYINQKQDWNCTCFLYPERREEKRKKGLRQYILSYPGLGSTGVKVWIRHDPGHYAPVIDIGNTDGWKKLEGKFTLPNPTGINIWVLRWANLNSHNIRSCRGVVDIDDITIKEEGSSKNIFEANFDNGSMGSFSNCNKTRKVTLEKEEENYFVRIETTDDVAKLQQSIISGISAKLKPHTNYIVSCKARATITKTPRGYVWAPIFIKLDKTDKKEAIFSCHYEYTKEGKKIIGKEEKLKVKIEPYSVKAPKEIEIILWSEAEDAMGWQPKETQDILVKITKLSGIKTHFTRLDTNPWMAPYYGDLNKVPLYNPLSRVIHKYGMKVMPYIGTSLYNKDNANINYYLEKNPEARAINSLGDKIYGGNFHGICPSYLLSKDSSYWKIYLDFLEKSAEKNGWDGIFWDFEFADILGVPSKHMGRARCFCPRCVEEFKKFSGIEDITKPPKDEVMLEKNYPYDKLKEPARSILKNYPLEWLKW